MTEATEQNRITPLAIERAGERDIRIKWKDGQESLFAARGLRLACPCAACVDELTGKRVVDPAKVPDDVEPKGIGLVGRYAISVLWSDGHATGIYSFTYLRGLRL